MKGAFGTGFGGMQVKVMQRGSRRFSLAAISKNVLVNVVVLDTEKILGRGRKKRKNKERAKEKRDTLEFGSLVEWSKV